MKELLKNALQNLHQIERLEEYITYLHQEWFFTVNDLALAIEDNKSWSDLKLPARLKLEMKKMVLESQKEEKREEDDSSELSAAAKWQKCYSAEHNAYYYYNHRTDETVWELPQGEKWTADETSASSDDNGMLENLLISLNSQNNETSSEINIQSQNLPIFIDHHSPCELLSHHNIFVLPPHPPTYAELNNHTTNQYFENKKLEEFVINNTPTCISNSEEIVVLIPYPTVPDLTVLPKQTDFAPSMQLNIETEQVVSNNEYNNGFYYTCNSPNYYSPTVLELESEPEETKGYIENNRRERENETEVEINNNNNNISPQRIFTRPKLPQNSPSTFFITEVNECTGTEDASGVPCSDDGDDDESLDSESDCYDDDAGLGNGKGLGGHGSGPGLKPDQRMLQRLLEMGFESSVAELALVNNRNNLSKSASFLIRQQAIHSSATASARSGSGSGNGGVLSFASQSEMAPSSSSSSYDGNDVPVAKLISDREFVEGTLLSGESNRKKSSITRSLVKRLGLARTISPTNPNHDEVLT